MLPIRDRQSSNIFPIVSWGIILLNAYVLWVEFNQFDLTPFFDRWALIPIKVSFSDFATLYPFVTSIFLHAGLWHFISNMWFLRIFGDNVEGDLRHLFFLGFYLLGGVVAGLIQYLVDPTSAIPMVGASGAIAAVLGYYLIRFPHHTVDTLIPVFTFLIVQLPAQIVLFMWIVTQIFNGTASLVETAAEGGVAWWAHIGGFAFGVLVAVLTKKTPKSLH